MFLKYRGDRRKYNYEVTGGKDGRIRSKSFDFSVFRGEESDRVRADTRGLSQHMNKELTISKR